MATYTEEQLARYFEHIGFRHEVNAARQHMSRFAMGILTVLQMRHMARVPFECLSLHYSRSRLLSLEPDDLFEKIVNDGKGGYCMEVNTFFAAVLRSVGFTLFSAGARVRGPEGYKGWDHMVNLVTVEGTCYLVDVGFGANGPPRPVALCHDNEFDCIAPARGRLQHRKLDEHTDPDQRVWVYSVQENAGAPWKDMYCFVEVEFLPGDFEVMNLSTMTAPQSIFVQNVICVRTVLGRTHEDISEPTGLLILRNNEVKQRMGDRSEIVERLETEEQRVKALEKYFHIVLSPEEQRAIGGLVTELKKTQPEA